MSKEYRIFPLDHPNTDYNYLVWRDNKNTIIGESRKDNLNPHPMKLLSIHDEDFLPWYSSDQVRTALNDQLTYQLCGLKEKLFYKFDLLFAPAPEPKRYA